MPGGMKKNESQYARPQAQVKGAERFDAMTGYEMLWLGSECRIEVEYQRVAMEASARWIDDEGKGMGAGVELNALSVAHREVDSNRRQSAPTIIAIVEGVPGGER